MLIKLQSRFWSPRYLGCHGHKGNKKKNINYKSTNGKVGSTISYRKIGPLPNEKKVHEELGTYTINFTERKPFNKSKLIRVKQIFFRE